MDFLNLLIPQEKIVGIEISSRKLRMLYLEKDAVGRIRVAGRSEVDLEEGVIVSGGIKDKSKLSSSLAKLKKDFKPEKCLSNFAIVTISQNGVYSDIFEFPSGLSNDQLIGAISMNAAANLPLPLSECYLDWQAIGIENNKKKVLVSLVSKKIADDYISILKENGFDLIALEPYSLSIARSCDIPEEPVIFLNFTAEGVTSVVYDRRAPYFSQFELWKEVSRKKEIKGAGDFAGIASRKIRKLSNYFESRYSPMKIERVLMMAYGADAKEIIKKMDRSGVEPEEAKPKIDLTGDNEWVPVAGAAMRAFIPRSEDTIISLLPVGTESLYETQKAVSFAKSIQLLILSLAAFYVLVFAVALAFTSLSLTSVDRQLNLRSNAAVPTEYLKLDSEAREFNVYVSDLLAIYPKIDKDYSSILENIAQLNTPGILLTSINFTDLDGQITLSGVASTRLNLSAFKAQIENSDSFDNARFSIQNIAQKDNIPFSISLHKK